MFQVQPLIGKRILPWFGGTPSVWTTCMLFFQVTLLLGYLYAHLVSARLRPRTQAIVHLCLLGAAVLLLPVYPGTGYKPLDPANPTWRIIGLLAATVALPYFALSATSPLLQRWFTLAKPSASPYRLYAVSNAGSLLALVSYPFLFEPNLTGRAQSLLWAAGFALFALLCAACAMVAFRRPKVKDCEKKGPPPASAPPEPRPRVGSMALWLGLACAPAIMLLAVTNEMCQDVAVVPFLWLLPLSLYLVSFIICFENERWYYRPVFWALLAASVAAACWVILQAQDASMLAQVGILSAALFACCMVCHGELARRKPGARHLTLFYLLLSAGGALGGIFVTLVAPLIFPLYFELHVGLLACCALAATALWLDMRRRWAGLNWWPSKLCYVFPLVIGPALLAAFLTRDVLLSRGPYMVRNFYGVLLVWQRNIGDPQLHDYVLGHGRIVHGTQFALGEKSVLPTAYYGVESGVGLTLKHFPKEGPLRVGVVGLGTATLAAYGRKDDYYRFYEINPNVVNLAKELFTYLRNSPAENEIVLGDARLSLEREPPQRFDVLVLDAFTSDAIPVHLLTQEAFQTYFRHLAPGGVICVNVSNRHLDLTRVLWSEAKASDVQAVTIASAEGEYTMAATWVLLTANKALLAEPAIRAAEAPPPTAGVRWTDDFSNLFGILRR